MTTHGFPTVNRRQMLFMTAAAAALAACGRAAEGGLTLGQAGQKAGLMVGCAYGDEIFKDQRYADLVARESSIATLTNAMKFDWLRPRGPEADFSMADRLVDFGTQNGITIRGSAPIWNDWPAAWLKGETPERLRGYFDRHVDEVVSRYAGRIPYWDLVNEPFEPLYYDSQGWRRGPWWDAFGKDYIGRALRRAHAADPGTRLFINEAALEGNDDVGRSLRPHALTELKKLLDAGVPLHGLGVQSHLKPGNPHNYAEFADFLRQVGDLGLEIHLTELDVFDDPFPDDIAARDAAVADVYRDYLTHVLAVPQVKAITVWGLVEPYGYPWWFWQNVRGGVGRAPRGNLYGEDFVPRPSREAVLQALGARG